MRGSGDHLVLVVEDDDDLRALAEAALGQASLRTITVASGDAAFAAAKKERPDLAVVDVHLPDISGYEVCRRLKESAPGWLPVILVSAVRTESYDRVAGLMIGADDYLVKPYAYDELIARCRVLIARSNDRRSSVLDALTAREASILRLLAEGRDQNEIAQALSISSKTVATHIEHILSKLDVGSRAKAVALAYREGLMARRGSVDESPF